MLLWSRCWQSCRVGWTAPTLLNSSLEHRSFVYRNRVLRLTTDQIHYIYIVVIIVVSIIDILEQARLALSVAWSGQRITAERLTSQCCGNLPLPLDAHCRAVWRRAHTRYLCSVQYWCIPVSQSRSVSLCLSVSLYLCICLCLMHLKCTEQVDTLHLAKTALQANKTVRSHTLPDLYQLAAGVPLVAAHDALADAKAVATVSGSTTARLVKLHLHCINGCLGAGLALVDRDVRSRPTLV